MRAEDLVSLPFRRDPQEVGEFRSGALKRFYKLERRLEMQPELKKQYVAFMDEYLKLGHISLIIENERKATRTYYLSHHAVVTKVNDRAKLKLVFDALAKRAIRALQQVALENQRDHPVASKVILRNFYVDDLLTGCDKLNEIRTLKQEITQILESAGFQLAKWNSNEQSLIPTTQGNAVQCVNIGDEIKTLGLIWNAGRDALQYQVQLKNTEQRVTKRTVLLIMSQIFDPLGLVGPSTIKAKLMLQQIWKLKLKWDESVSSSLHTEWIEYVSMIASINEIRILRVVICKNPVKIELHGFSDASQNAYGACIYLRSVNQPDHTTVWLLCAKSRVAPLETISLPRLELCGAVLLVRLMHEVIETLTISIQSCHLWCDSTIVLAWIRDEPYLGKTFVVNRITEIQQLTEKSMWHHVLSEDNPADYYTRNESQSIETS
ncbi:uncharacterized protein LOC105200092 [Solenopsis invicta]|uniref:uncharacterized protein LOC105200092 n=1 Tax=Solenopsis invicta TaxID=13686 RepID=UPI000596393F|nr:uncharacterized protein LOC105200092 [Solenopsis invicta]